MASQTMNSCEYVITIKSLNTKKIYEMIMNKDGKIYECSCPSFEYNKSECKHIRDSRTYQEIRRQPLTIEIIKDFSIPEKVESKVEIKEEIIIENFPLKDEVEYQEEEYEEYDDKEKDPDYVYETDYDDDELSDYESEDEKVKQIQTKTKSKQEVKTRSRTPSPVSPTREIKTQVCPSTPLKKTTSEYYQTLLKDILNSGNTNVIKTLFEKGKFDDAIMNALSHKK
jgi:hypothetical protein